MKTDELNLTIGELDKLCRLYMDCQLSVLEEKELEYILSRTALTSPSIEEVRRLIGIHTLKPSSSNPSIRKKFIDWRIPTGIVAGIAMMLCVGSAFLKSGDSISSVSNDYIAYVNGREIRGDVAKARIEAETRKAEDFINRMAKLEKEEQNKIEQFMNHQNDIK